MKVGFLFLHPFSGSLGSTVVVRELAISLHRLGVDCFILSPFESARYHRSNSRRMHSCSLTPKQNQTLIVLKILQYDSGEPMSILFSSFPSSKA
jgi:hypothetical protein